MFKSHLNRFGVSPHSSGRRSPTRYDGSSHRQQSCSHQRCQGSLRFNDGQDSEFLKLCAQMGLPFLKRRIRQRSYLFKLGTSCTTAAGRRRNPMRVSSYRPWTCTLAPSSVSYMDGVQSGYKSKLGECPRRRVAQEKEKNEKEARAEVNWIDPKSPKLSFERRSTQGGCSCRTESGKALLGLGLDLR